MAAILPHLEIQNDPSEIAAEDTLFRKRRLPIVDPDDGFSGLGEGALDPSKDAATVMNASHAELTNTAWLRAAHAMALDGREYRLYTQGRDVWVEFEGEKITGPAYSRVGSPTTRATLVSWTAKMGCPSFSLPAGPMGFGGACPGAVGRQSIVPVETLRRAQDRVSEVTRAPANVLTAVCQRCYAEGANYQYASTQFAQVARYAWAKNAIQQEGSGDYSSQFVEVMDWAVKNADYKTSSFKAGKTTVRKDRHGKFFRIHDSGDFFALPYLMGWNEVALLNPDVTFWAPSRVWASGQKWIEWVNEYRTAPNFVVRPSGFHVNESVHRDLGPGWANWTTVYSVGVKPHSGDFVDDAPDAAYNWDCHVYQIVDEAHNCRNALAPDGKVGCRACWIHPELSVNYTEH